MVAAGVVVAPPPPPTPTQTRTILRATYLVLVGAQARDENVDNEYRVDEAVQPKHELGVGAGRVGRDGVGEGSSSGG